MAEFQDNNVIKLLVKAPDQRIDDQVIECQLDWSIEKLKHHLEEFYPNNPKPYEQKIILSGQVLSDLVILKDVLQEHHIYTENTYIIHLVCKSLTRYSTPITKQTTTTTSTINANTAGTTTTTTTNTETPTHPTVNLSNPVSAQSSFMQYQQHPGVQLNNQQIVWMQQAYAHYLTQYMQIMSAQAMQWQSTIPYTQTSTNTDNNLNNVGVNGMNNNTDNINERNGRNPINPPAPAQPQVGALINPPNNNNVGEEREAGARADWLDTFEILARLFVLCSIVYFYSSPSRFLIVTFLGFAVYLIQGGFLRIPPLFLGENNNGVIENNNNNNIINNNNNNNNNQQQQENNVGQVPVGQEQRQDVQSQQTNNELQVQTDQQTNVVRDNERPNALAFAWTFFSTFFTSLIPEQPPVI